MCDTGVPNSILTNVVLEHTRIIYIYIVIATVTVLMFY